jgi:ABC-type transport system involved in cytochrome bd biosynthesis fused ATPase/permease subunit
VRRESQHGELLARTPSPAALVTYGVVVGVVTVGASHLFVTAVGFGTASHAVQAAFIGGISLLAGCRAAAIIRWLGRRLPQAHRSR